MRLLHLSWEYPPHSVGGLARHVEDLTQALVQENQEVHVLTVGQAGEEQLPSKRQGGVFVHRVEAYPIHTPDFLTWVLQLNIRFLEEAMRLWRTAGPFHLIHAHDWLVAFAGRALKHAHRIPLVATIHATEAGRNRGIHNDLQRYIHSVEWWLTYEAWKVIVCSQHMREEVQGLFQVPSDKITVIPNGVVVSKFSGVQVDPALRQRYALPQEKIIFYVGRLVVEKGVQVLLEAMPKVLEACPEAKLVVAGQGPMEGELKGRTWELGIAHKVAFTGYIDDRTRNQLYRVADVAVFPSLYEPFGIVALEAMAAGVPVVVSETGGLKEIVTHQVNGLRASPGNPNSLADNIIALLRDKALASALRKAASRLVKEVYDWRQIARRTLELYHGVYEEYRHTPWAERSSIVDRFRRYALALAGYGEEEGFPGEAPEKVLGGGRYDLVGHRAALVNQKRGREGLI
ncbi:Glycosyltransferase involved in cell wall bisynthesis [Thermanaeromonas toyohensis ToBE]|uniref:Glycosyltransferase involved in cell wall bisynthesis n=1 Tax=Thermanaeromonas toyohensis ToBE TaxID=698762 RepID=A0A1W1W2G4_9FIRM|nr:glycosyltransferase family 4 protein [Thermanaeromonas toyohensis]SMB99294.1 Glycosyltransferase involved in cell wall bisynthesis [Thermanaeromonas toyohensis ToBE]